jgi:hypothetical protein
MKFIDKIRQHEETRADRLAAIEAEVAAAHARLDAEEYENGRSAGRFSIQIIESKILEAIDNKENHYEYFISSNQEMEPFAKGRYDSIHTHFEAEGVTFVLKYSKKDSWVILFKW